MSPKKLLLFGNPVGHSRSPAMHAAALQAVGLRGWSYTAQAVLPEELAQAVARLRLPEYAGANITIPHKERVIILLDRLTPAAEAVGAVNTIFKENDRLVGDNTDAPGFLADLQNQVVNSSLGGDEDSIDFSPPNYFLGELRRALVLGAGGSARAVVFALHQTGWQVTIAARRLEQAQSIASQYPSGSIQAIPLEKESLLNPIQTKNELRSDSQSSEHSTPIPLLVNTTPLGMHPDIESCPWPADLPLPPHSFVYDLVYQPARTVLLARAESAKLHHANGLGMLVEQAALSFERWTGLSAPRSIMFQAVQV